MTHSRQRILTSEYGLVLIAILVPLFCPGCAGLMGRLFGNTPPRPTHQISPYPHRRTIAIAPLANLTGTRHFDPVAVSDLFYSELQQVQGFEVIPVNRTLETMSVKKITAVRSPVEALQLAEAMGADAIVAGAITEYDPYNPPVVGVALQLYVLPPVKGQGGVDPYLTARMPAPWDVPAVWPDRPMASVVRIYNAAHEPVAARLKQYAEARSEADSPFGYRRYKVSMDDYMRFCAHETVRHMLASEAVRLMPVSAVGVVEQ